MLSMEVGFVEGESGDVIRVEKLCCNNEAECVRCSRFCERLESRSLFAIKNGEQSKGRAREVVVVVRRNAKPSTMASDSSSSRTSLHPPPPWE